MTRKTFREKLGIFLITLGVLGGLYGLFSSLAQAASREEGPGKENRSTPANRILEQEPNKDVEELEDLLEATRLTLAEERRKLEAVQHEKERLEAHLQRRHADDRALVEMAGKINGETGIDAFDNFMERVRQKLQQDGRIMVPGALLTEGFTLADLLQAIETASTRGRLPSV